MSGKTARYHPGPSAGTRRCRQVPALLQTGALLCVLAGLILPGRAAWCEGGVEAVALGPAEYAAEPVLGAWLWQHSPDVVEARAAAGVAASEVTRSRLYPNPARDFTWG